MYMHYVCVCVYMCMYIYVCVYIYIYPCINIYLFVDIRHFQISFATCALRSMAPIGVL